MSALDTVVVAPLLRTGALPKHGRFLIEVEVQGETLAVDPALLANIERRQLGAAKASLTAYEDELRRGLDRLFNGF